MNTLKSPAETAGKTLPAAETAAFCRQLAMLLKSGIMLYYGMELLYHNYEDTPYKDSFEKIYIGLREGGTLYDGVTAAGIFPPYMVQMVRVGEMTGELERTLEKLADYYEKEHRLRAEVRHAVTYPLVLLVMLTAVIAVLVIRVLPVFSQVFRSLGVEVAGTAGAVLSGGVVLGRVMLGVSAALLLLALSVLVVWFSGGRQDVLRLAGKLFPAIRRLQKKQAAQRFAQVVSMVLYSGYSLEKAVELLPEVINDPEIAEKARQCQELMQKNGDFFAAVAELEIFEPLEERMIHVGCESGHTDQVLSHIADMYDEQVTEGIQRISGRIEPALVAVLTVVIGGILLSVMLPLAGLLTAMG